MRYLARLGVEDAGMVWGREFQARGAPHWHVDVWGRGIEFVDLRQMKRWASRAWVEVVGHQDPVQRAKHLKAGMRVEELRHKDFRYLSGYINKPGQKVPPEGFDHVGRYWGVVNAPSSEPITLTAGMSLGEVHALVERLASVVAKYAPHFAEKLRARWDFCRRYSFPFAFELWGRPAVDAVLQDAWPARPVLHPSAEPFAVDSG